MNMCLGRFGVQKSYKRAGIAFLIAMVLLGLWGFRACVPFLEAVRVSDEVLQALASNDTDLLSKSILCEECRQRVWSSWQKTVISGGELLEWRFRRVVFVLEFGMENQDSEFRKYEVEYTIFLRNSSYLAVFEVLNEKGTMQVVDLKLYEDTRSDQGTP